MTRVGLEWGTQALRHHADVVVVVDVLSFTTTLTVGRTVGRSTGAVSLSPGSVRAATGVRRLVMPSPNGSSIAHRAAGLGPTVLGACLRNASAVVAWLGGRDLGDVLLVPAGERWPDGSLRPAVEDLLGAGAVALGLTHLGVDLTPEAHAAAAAFQDARASLTDRLMASVSGRELVAKRFPEDVAAAAELDTCPHAAVLEGAVFRAG